MSAAYSPSPGIGATDPALPDGPPANLSTARELLDNRRFLRGATWGLLLWNGRMEVSGTAAAPVVTLGAIEACVLRRSSGAVRAFYDLDGATLGASHVEGGGSLAANDWYYVYAINAGTDAASTMTYEISQTAPTASGVFKDDGITELSRYLGCFPTDSTGKPVPCYRAGRRTLYRRSAIASVSGLLAADGLRALERTTTQVGVTAVDLASRIPPHARLALLDLEAVNSDPANTTTFRVYTGGDSTSPATELLTTGSKTMRTRAEILTSASQTVAYTLGVDAGTMAGIVDLVGWEE